MSDGSETGKTPRRQTVRQVFLRGLAISLPAVLTIVILLWLIGGISAYIIDPTTASVKYVIAQFLDRSVDPTTAKLAPLLDGPALPFCGDSYLVNELVRKEFDKRQVDLQVTTVKQGDEPLRTKGELFAGLNEYFTHKEQLTDWIRKRADEQPELSLFAEGILKTEIYVPVGGRAVPYSDYRVVARDTSAGAMPASATGLYMEFAVRRYLGSALTLSVFALSLVIVVIYFLGRIVSVRLGSWVVGQIETRLLGRLPVIRNVYGSAKQVTDFLFSEQQVEYRRVVAIEYPRRGIWSLGLVTGDSMLDITTAVGEPCVSILVPSSPMPVTGYTVSVPRSTVLDLDVTVDQALQFCISCGVLVPDNQKVTPEILQRELARRLAERMQDSPADRRALSPPPRVSDDDDEDGSRRS